MRKARLHPPLLVAHISKTPRAGRCRQCNQQEMRMPWHADPGVNSDPYAPRKRPRLDGQGQTI
eukprot:1165216-Prymnesium_polylepis.1